MPRPPGHTYYANMPHKTTGIDATEEESVELMNLKKQALDASGYGNEYDEETTARSLDHNTTMETQGLTQDDQSRLTPNVETPRSKSFNELV